MQSWIHVIEWRANVRPDVTALADDRGAAFTLRGTARADRARGGRLGRARGRARRRGRASSRRTAPTSWCTRSR